MSNERSPDDDDVVLSPAEWEAFQRELAKPPCVIPQLARMLLERRPWDLGEATRY